MADHDEPQRADEQEQAPERIGDLMLDRYRLGELSSDETARLEARLEKDDVLKSRLSRLEKESEQFQELQNTRALAAVVMERTERQRHGYGFGLLLQAPFLTAVVAAAAVLVAIWVSHLEPPPTDPVAQPYGYRIKGDKLTMSVQVKRNGRQWRYEADQWLYEGDLLRFAFNAKVAGFLYVITMDSADQLTVFEPADGAAARRVEAADKQLVKGAYELDATLGEEVVVLFVCKTQQGLAALKASVRRWENARRLDNAEVRPVVEGERCQEAHVVLRKRTKPPKDAGIVAADMAADAVAD
jgi:hypothetical protein